MSSRSPFRLSRRPTVLLCRIASLFHVGSQIIRHWRRPRPVGSHFNQECAKKNLPALRVEERGDLAREASALPLGDARIRYAIHNTRYPNRAQALFSEFSATYFLHIIAGFQYSLPILRIRWDSSIASSSYLCTCRRCSLSPSSQAPRPPSRSPRSSRRCRRGVSDR